MDPDATARLRDQATAVARTVASATREGAPTKIMTLVQVLPAPVAATWQAITNPGVLPLWFLPLDGELREGGRYVLTGNASGTIVSCRAEEELALTWEYGGRVSWLGLRLSPVADPAVDGGQATELTLAHENPVDPAGWAEYGAGAVGVGWDQTLLGLALFLSDVDPTSADGGIGWLSSEAGAVFVRAVSEAWSVADVADGMDPEEAGAAAARTVRFYTEGR